VLVLLCLNRDVKSPNVLLDDNMCARLGDAGIARILDPEVTGGNMTQLQVQNLHYLHYNATMIQTMLATQ
jgi:serine/threonine protein kinase